MKTLKDIEHCGYCIGCSADDEICKSSDGLRQAAIEDIKELRSGKLVELAEDEWKNITKVISRNEPHGKIETFHIEQYIKKKFNITEEDLK